MFNVSVAIKYVANNQVLNADWHIRPALDVVVVVFAVD